MNMNNFPSGFESATERRAMRTAPLIPPWPVALFAARRLFFGDGT